MAALKAACQVGVSHNGELRECGCLGGQGLGTAVAEGKDQDGGEGV